nr:hypothetical protein CTRU02_13489 [Colletotrichum truncatum]
MNFKAKQFAHSSRPSDLG